MLDLPKGNHININKNIFICQQIKIISTVTVQITHYSMGCTGLGAGGENCCLPHQPITAHLLLQLTSQDKLTQEGQKLSPT